MDMNFKLIGMKNKNLFFDNVILYPANMVTYLRYTLLEPYCYFAFYNPIITVSLATSSSILDMADGHVAKISNMKSNLGAILDMIVDRLYYAMA